jgi:hypothetical protein
MTPPKTLYRVEWTVARRYDRPDDRVTRARIFTSAHAAAQQVRAVSIWVPSHAQLLGVWRTCGADEYDNVAWTEIDPDTGLPALLPHVAARYDVMEASIHDETIPRHAVLMIAVDDDDE